jgi:hypothetical protein
MNPFDFGFSSFGSARGRAGTLVTAAAIALTVNGCGSDKKGTEGGAGGALTSTGGATTGAGGSLFEAGGAAPACLNLQQTCDDSSQCCSGLFCNTTGPAPEWIGCQKPCATSAECPSTCCLPFQGQNHGFCTDPKWCACGATAARCGSTLPKCCDTHVCLGGDAQATFYECKKKCTQNTDCDTGCCVAIPNLNISACLAASYCGK